MSGNVSIGPKLVPGPCKIEVTSLRSMFSVDIVLIPLIHILCVALAALAGCQQRSERWRVEMLDFHTGEPEVFQPPPQEISHLQ